MNKNKYIIKKGKVELPREISKTWDNAEITMLPSEDNDTLIIKRMQKPLRHLSEIAERNPLPRLSTQALNQEIKSYRAHR